MSRDCIAPNAAHRGRGCGWGRGGGRRRRVVGLGDAGAFLGARRVGAWGARRGFERPGRGGGRVRPAGAGNGARSGLGRTVTGGYMSPNR